MYDLNPVSLHLYGVTYDELDEDQRNYIVSNKKLLATGWRPKKSVNIGIKELIKCYDYFEVNNNKNFV